MKTRLIFLAMLVVCVSCGTNTKPLSDAQKEKIRGEIKEVVNTFIKGCEEVNFDMENDQLLDSPDFIYIYNGASFSYKEVADGLKSLCGTIINAKVTVFNEKYVFLDNSIVSYTANAKWLTNYKDGHSVYSDPMIFQFTFKKINDKWKAINAVESSVEKSAKNTETSKELNQIELVKQMIGTWRGEFTNKDSIIIAEIKSFGDGGLEGTQKWLYKGKVFSEEKFVFGYDKKSDKYIGAGIGKNYKDIFLMATWYTSKNTYERIPLEFISNPEQASSKAIYEFKSPDLFMATFIQKGKPDKTYKWVRVR